MITFVVASIGRPSLRAALDSIACGPGDEIVVVGSMGAVTDPRVRFVPCEPGRDWGHTERNVAAPHIRTRYFANLDDDDRYAPTARVLMADAIAQAPDRPVLFRMMYPNGYTLWDEPVLKFGNVGTPMMLIPNIRERLGAWGSYNGGDFGFLSTSGWAAEEYVWRTDIIALLGHNAPGQS